jgi:hypothetical protein
MHVAIARHAVARAIALGGLAVDEAKLVERKTLALDDILALARHSDDVLSRVRFPVNVLHARRVNVPVSGDHIAAHISA